MKKVLSAIFILLLLSFSLPSLSLADGEPGIFASTDTANLAHALDDDENTSANIYTGQGYITYRMDLVANQLITGAVGLILSAADGGAYQVKVENLDNTLAPVPGSEKILDISGYKGDYRFDYVTMDGYLKISGIGGAALYIFDIYEYTPAPPGDRYSQANNLDHAFDGNDSTSANIFTGDGYITYFAGEDRFLPGMSLIFNMNAADGRHTDVTVTAYSIELYFDPETAVSESQTITIDGFKNTYEYAVPVWAAFIKISGLQDTPLYIYEIYVKEMLPPGDIQKYANNLDHAFDGDDSTSANIFTGDGYIYYLGGENRFLPGMSLIFNMNAADGRHTDVTVTAYSSELYFDPDTAVTQSQTITIDGFKNTYEYTVPVWAAFIKISGLQDTALYIYEIYAKEMLPPGDVCSKANNPDHAFDDSLSTSANIFSQDGAISFFLPNRMLVPGVDHLLTMNAADGRDCDVEITAYDVNYYFDPQSAVSETQTISISGFKNTYIYTIPPWAVYIKMSGIPDTQLYIYDITQYDPEIHYAYYLNANNIEDGYDRDELTSANIFPENGYIIFDAQDSGLVLNSYANIMMNAFDGSAQDVTISSLDFSRMPIPGSEEVLHISGFKPVTSYFVPAGCRYIKISGVSGAALYIYEIYPSVSPDLSQAVPSDNMDGSMTLFLSLRDEMDLPVTGLGMGDIRIWMDMVETWDTLSALDASGYWDIQMSEPDPGDYEIVILRTGSLPYTRTWKVGVYNVEVSTFMAEIS